LSMRDRQPTFGLDAGQKRSLNRRSLRRLTQLNEPLPSLRMLKGWLGWVDQF
jgi:hypothetical protein